MSRITLRQRISTEWFTWASLAIVSALLEGGVLGVIVKNGFAGQVDSNLLNFAVALVTGAPYFSNLLSIYWVSLSRGKSKARMVSNLAMVFCICAFLMGFVPFNELGLLLFIFLLVIARICWSGVLTVRSNIWRANYPRYIRGKVTAKLATLASIMMSFTAISVGWLLDQNFQLFQVIFISLSVLSIFGAYRYRSLAVRHQQKEIVVETNNQNKTTIKSVFSILKTNKPFSRYMLSMFVLGSGNLMFMAPMIVFLNEHTALLKLDQILISTAIPLALIPIAVNRWAKLLDGNHIFHFRSIHSWVFVIALIVFLLAQLTLLTPLYYLASIIYGVAIAGGVIGWNLGHNDFVGKGSPMDYMAIHVTLTGVRGLFMPIVGISLYQYLETLNHGLGKWALLLPLTITTIGALLFVYFHAKNKTLK